MGGMGRKDSKNFGLNQDQTI